MRSEAGFTLVEVMVATLIMATLSAMGLTMLNNAMDAKAQIETRTDGIQALELARAVMRDDLAQLAAHRARAPYGDFQHMDFIGGEDLRQEQLFAFVRNGVETPGLQSVASSLQYVEYVLDADQLIRRTRAFVDANVDTPERDRVLLEGVSELSVLFYDGVNWNEVWLGDPGATGAVNAPRAVAVNLSLDWSGGLRMLFLTPRGM